MPPCLIHPSPASLKCVPTSPFVFVSLYPLSFPEPHFLQPLIPSLSQNLIFPHSSSSSLFSTSFPSHILFPVSSFVPHLWSFVFFFLSPPLYLPFSFLIRFILLAFPHKSCCPTSSFVRIWFFLVFFFLNLIYVFHPSSLMPVVLVLPSPKS